MTKFFVADTNVLLDKIESLQDYKIVLLSHTLVELDKHKSNHRDGELAYKARKAVRYINENPDKFIFDSKVYDGRELGEGYSNTYEDYNVVHACIVNGYGVISDDLLLTYVAKGFGIEVVELDSKKEDLEYSGIHEIYIDDSTESQEILANVYQSPDDNIFNLEENQYVVLWDKSKPTYHRATGKQNGYEAIDAFKFNGQKLTKVKYKNPENMFMGKTKPLNIKQSLAFDLLQSKNIGVHLLLGQQGTGKDYLMLAHMLQDLDRGEYNKIVFIRNIQPLKNFGETGFLKGDLETKMKSWLLPIADTIGGEEALQMLLDKGKIEIQHGEAIRGRSYVNSAVYCMECQNMSDEHMRVLLARIGEGSKLFMNGDLQQIDNQIFKTNSGIRALTKLRGNRLFGMVTLDKTERSDIASLSELI